MNRVTQRWASVLPTGTGAVGVWIAASGALAYAFLAITGRALGPTSASGLSTLWVVGFLVGQAAGLPLEQEVSRAISSRRARHVGVGPVVLRAAIAGAVFTAVVVIAIFAGGSWLVDRLFGGNWLLLVSFAVLFVGTMIEYLVRGVLAGSARFGAYGRLIGAEAGVRVAAVAILAAVGVDRAGPYGLVLAVAPFFGVGVALIGGERSDFGEPGPSAAWSELTRSLGWLFAGALFAQALVNLGPVSVRLLEPNSGRLISAFVASLIVARVPVFLFQAAQAALLPRLSHHAGGGRAEVLAAETAALVRALGVLVFVAAGGAALLGPTVVRIGWGDGFALGASDFAVLAAASCIYLIALTIAQALLALECPNRATWAWALGVGALSLCVVFGDDVLTRVEVGFLVGTLTSAAAMGVLLRRPMTRARTSAPVPDRAGGDR
ncbi:MAG: hypothetical protein ABJC79_02545 [Acidimicrobiia bacterium]